MTTKLLSPQQAANRLRLSLSRVHQFLQDDRLRGIRVGNSYVIEEDVVEEFAKLPRNPGRPPQKTQKKRAG